MGSNMDQTSIKIIRDPISRHELLLTSKQNFGNFVKAVTDVEQKIIAVGGDLHADEEALLMEDGSEQQNLWGINLYPEKLEEEWIEFDSMINIRPSQNNSSRHVENPEVREKIKTIIRKLIV